MDDLPEGIDSKFRYVMLVSKRAEQLIKGAMPKERIRNAKPTRIAMNEIKKGLVKWQLEPPEDEIQPIVDVLAEDMQ